MAAYYNEIEPFAAAWLRNLIAAGHIAYGVVDTRSIEDVRPDDLRGFTQCHFFAGLGAWSYALRRAGWPDDRPVWTGSCPCQPFSTAGKGVGFADERHLWPAWFHLISERRPATVFGEQVASKDGLGWFDLVHADMEGEGYAVAAADLCAAGVGAPHIRQRLWFVADADQRIGGQGRALNGRRNSRGNAQSRAGLGSGRADSGSERCEEQRVLLRQNAGRRDTREAPEIAWSSEPGALAHASSTRPPEQRGRRIESEGFTETGLTRGFWSGADWLYCRDEKWRPVESGTFPLVDGSPSRVGRLRAYGNAINPEVAQAFIESTGLI